MGGNFSPDFPTTPSAFQAASLNFAKAQEPNSTAFVTKFNASEMKSNLLTTTSLTADVNPQIRQSKVVFTAAVSPESGSGTPAGSVQFTSTDGILCSSNLDSTAHATCATQDLLAGWHEITAVYLGDLNYAPSRDSIVETINGIPTTTTISSSQTTPTYGAAVTFTAYVRPTSGSGIPTSLVSFNIGNLSLAQVPLDSTGHASYTIPAIDIGKTTVTAFYYGDTNYASSSASVTETVQPLGITPSPTFSPAPGTFSDYVSVTISDANRAAKIYYTADGTTPTSGLLPLVGSFWVTATETIQAIAVAPGYSPSAVASSTYTINLPPPDFSISLAPASLSMSAGQKAVTTVTVSALNGFNQGVQFSCPTLPAGLSCSFSPSTVNPGGVSGSVTLSISAAQRAAKRPGPLSFLPLTSLALVLCTIGSRKRRSYHTCLLIVAGLLGMVTLNACGGGGSGGSTKSNPVISTVAVAATSGSIQHVATLTVTVN